MAALESGQHCACVHMSLLLAADSADRWKVEPWKRRKKVRVPGGKTCVLFFVESDFAESAPLRGHLSVMRLQEASEAAVGGALWHRMSEMRHIRSYSFGTLELETLQPRGLAVAFTHV